ncbi:hypothetical protein CAPTEDRAFT_224419 [Capitella teleta]|uniref:UDENN FLCN/SMCR8-type domain-containing protein n=1 Tax=Capitella teleta TaxID=283909 RepID=R7TQQ0_CAPTE|nr:hypothetical protein CAPTEDRAFT_224419 [Capitella teleta]|eukprot:ELT95887.1 hypothetical protein CAPTEDRAFT_224419 [Capitella teleta]
MFGGYTEVAAYYVDNEPLSSSGYPELPLPEEYIPPYSTPDPWHQKAACQEDFILIAEFSEREGPKPVITIPTNCCQKAKNGFDLNDFSVRLMSVDFQTVAGDSFALSEDSYVLVSETKYGIYAYVHHFTLYDSQARGFVRPFCMAFVTPDHGKLIASHKEMASEFSKVSHCFKYGNLLLFVKDMSYYLSDLMYTKERFSDFEKIREKEKENDDENPQELLLLEAFNNPNEDHILESVTEQGLATAIREVKHILDVTTVLMNDSDMEQRFRTLEQKSRSTSESNEGNELSSENFQYSCSLHSESGQPWTDAEKVAQHRPSSVNDLEDSWNMDHYEMYKPRVVRTTNKKGFDESLRTLHELCRWGAKEGLGLLRGIHRYFSRDMTTLHIERRDAASIEPSPGLLTIGRSVQLNFLSCAGPLKSVSDEVTSPCSLVSSPSGNITQRWLSDDTLASFHSAESFLSCSEGASSDESKRSSLDRKLSEPEDVAGCASAFSSEYTVVRPDSLDFQSAVLFPQVPVISAADHITNLSTKSLGHGFLSFVGRYAVTPHVLFSLLCGRPLVIIGTTRKETDIRAMVTALCCFVPGHASHSVCAWLTRPLKLTDLSKFRLVGMGREKKSMDQLVPNSLKNYVSVLNMETKTLSCPAYQGGILTEIYKKRKAFRHEKPYLSYIHSVLYDLSHKALFYYHAFSTSEVAATNEITNSISTAERSRYQFLSNKFGSKLRLADCDIKIVQYLVEVIKCQQIQFLHKDESFPGAPQPNIKLQPSKCTVFKMS